MITELTKEQEEYLPVFRQRMLDIACNGKRIERDKLQSALNDAYALIDKEPPLLIILQSPLQANLAINFMKKFASGEMGINLKDQLWAQLRDQLGGQLGVQLGVQLEAQLGGQLEDHLGAQLGGHLWDQLGAQLRVQLRDQLEAQLGVQLWGQLGDQLRAQLGKENNGTRLWGSQDLYWIGFYKFCNEIGVNYTAEQKRILDINFRIGEQCEWWWPFDGICFVSEKPIEVKWDGDVLHNENGPSVLYQDGYSLYTWRGTPVPKEWIEDKVSLNPEMALTWENVEQRRCIAEIVGWHNVLDKLNAVTINKDDDPEIGELLEVELPNIGRERFLKVDCGTKRTFALPVPPDTQTALDGQAWLNFATIEDITNLEVRT